VRELAARLRSAGCVFAEEEARLLIAAAGPAAAAADADPVAVLEELAARRMTGEPLELVVGWAEFGGLRIAVTPGVFVPRRRSELLAREALAALAAIPGAGSGDRFWSGTVAVDLCCGAGGIGAVLLEACPGLELHAADLDAAAVRCARGNLVPRGGRVHQGDLYAALPPGLRGRVSLITANAPYVPSAEIPLLPAEARDHEPRTALDGGADGLDVLRRVLDGAGEWLLPGAGTVVLETSDRQAPALLEHAASVGLSARTVEDEDLAATALIATRSAATA